MTAIRLAKLPDRTPVKLTVTVLPDLHERLQAYAAAYAETYQVQEAVTELIPAMLAAFLDSHRDFARRQR